MPELRPRCEHCNHPVPTHSTDAMICSFECTRTSVRGMRRRLVVGIGTVARRQGFTVRLLPNFLF